MMEATIPGWPSPGSHPPLQSLNSQDGNEAAIHRVDDPLAVVPAHPVEDPTTLADHVSGPIHALGDGGSTVLQVVHAVEVTPFAGLRRYIGPANQQSQ